MVNFCLSPLLEGTEEEHAAVTIASVQQAAAFGDHNIQYQFRTEGGQVGDRRIRMLTSPNCPLLFSYSLFQKQVLRMTFDFRGCLTGHGRMTLDVRLNKCLRGVCVTTKATKPYIISVIERMWSDCNTI